MKTPIKLFQCQTNTTCGKSDRSKVKTFPFFICSFSSAAGEKDEEFSTWWRHQITRGIPYSQTIRRRRKRHRATQLKPDISHLQLTPLSPPHVPDCATRDRETDNHPRRRSRSRRAINPVSLKLKMQINRLRLGVVLISFSVYISPSSLSRCNKTAPSHSSTHFHPHPQLFRCREIISTLLPPISREWTLFVASFPRRRVRN